MLTLPSPESVPSLNDDVFARLNRKFPGVLPTRPLDQPNSDCKTCGGTRQFRWFADLQTGIVPVRRETPRVGEPDKVDVTYEIPSVPEIADYECPCWKQSRIQAYLLAHNVGKNSARYTWADTAWVPPDILGAMAEYAANCTDWANRGLGLFLHGLWGSGKTLVSTLILKAFLAAGVEGHWITFNEMLSMHTSSWRDQEAKEWFETRVRNAQVLVIDDIGKETSFAPRDEDGNVMGSNWGSLVSRALDSLFRARVQNGMVTIITANMHPEQVAANYTAALGSLATEACLPYEFPAQDVRQLYVERVKAEAKLGLTRPFTFV
jgi:DNA replication protein DnaC